MNKFVMALLVITLVSFTSCNSQETVKTIENSAEPVSSNSGLQIDPDQLENLEQNQKIADATVPELLAFIDQEALSPSGKALADLVPEVKEETITDTKTLRSQYDLEKGILLSIYTDQESDKIAAFQYSVSKLDATKSGIEYYSKCADATIRMFNVGSSEKIEQILGMSNIQEPSTFTVKMGGYQYEYAVTNDTVLFTVKVL
ncbi:hypothetical protein [Clostridium minihomine]|uniref:hypothetical protein n=1 Tax=Clostridium minihomine TaxID=2045012 RepID=UPI000C784DE8|nr:hypothetical protein [Clostridium minihomine]